MSHVPIKDLMAKFEPPMAPSLKKLLDRVWELRNEPDPDLYQVYVGGRPHGMEDDDSTWNRGQGEAFLLKLLSLPNRPRMIQEYGAVADYDTEGLSLDDLVGFSQDCAAEEKEGCERVMRDLSKSFFHYRKSGGADWRICLHVLPAFRGDVGVYIVSEVTPLEGVTNAKITGPPSKGWDSIVIYLSSEGALPAALQKIADYQKTHADQFGIETVFLARPIKEIDGVKLRGVAVAVEPGRHAEDLRPKKDGWRPSFGDFWETLLKPILKETRKLDKRQFVQRVIEEMTKLGLDPKNPER